MEYHSVIKRSKPLKSKNGLNYGMEMKTLLVYSGEGQRMRRDTTKTLIQWQCSILNWYVGYMSIYFVKIH